MEEQIITDFNNLLYDFVMNLADVCPTSTVCIHKKTVERELKKEENKKKFIEMFVGRVLQYKNQIDKGDETFFMEKSYNNDVDNSIMNQVFEFKDLWKTLKQENKEFVIQYMQLLCKLAQEYFILLC